MNTEIKSIDITHTPELLHLVEEVAATMQLRRFQKNGETIAVLMPVVSRKRTRRAPTRADREATLAAFGAWNGNVDVDQFKADLAASRLLAEESVTRTSSPKQPPWSTHQPLPEYGYRVSLEYGIPRHERHVFND